MTTTLSEQLATLVATGGRLSAPGSGGSSPMQALVALWVRDLSDTLHFQGSWGYGDALQSDAGIIRANLPVIVRGTEDQETLAETGNALEDLGTRAETNAAAFNTYQGALNDYEAQLPNTTADLLQALNLSDDVPPPELGDPTQLSSFFAALMTYLAGLVQRHQDQAAAIRDFQGFVGALDSLRLISGSLATLWQDALRDATAAYGAYNALFTVASPDTTMVELNLAGVEGDWQEIAALLGPAGA